MSKSSRIAVVAAAVALAAGPALAHPGHLAGAGFLDGASHPLGGIDHLIAMVTVGVYGATIGGRAVLAVPGAFLSAMLAGGMLALLGVSLPLVEPMIYASTVVLALLCVMPMSRHAGVGVVFAAAFGVFHGYAHGAEMPADAAALGYAAGFLLSTAALHAAGVVLGLAIHRLIGRPEAALE
ncbi:HupE/UreJ family protein [Azospirillum picis]|uniref:Urease accessory protein n=1 Tax=Azospirillum picis TaxID=488438 RepID=A0ABU0MLT5_9PROT|nr:HupE/UreJ family protein [Azospirillum picis]MBP2301076.1 urease accessory protein [Azospirillum picis]MDQ0534304.1 urease accessory protein [Azospirillum picis]